MNRQATPGGYRFRLATLSGDAEELPGRTVARADIEPAAVRRPMTEPVVLIAEGELAKRTSLRIDQVEVQITTGLDVEGDGVPVRGPILPFTEEPVFPVSGFFFSISSSMVRTPVFLTGPSFLGGLVGICFLLVKEPFS